MSQNEQDESERWIKWLLSFQSGDVEGLTKRELKKLSAEIRAFCFSYPFYAMDKGRTGIVPALRFWEGVERSDLSVSAIQRQIRGLHQKLREALHLLVPSPREASEESPSMWVTQWAIPAKTQEIRLYRIALAEKDAIPTAAKRDLGRTWRNYSADWPDLFWLAVADLIEEHSFRLTRCEECNTLFLKRKRQNYCSRQCSQRVRTRRWYATHKSEAKEKRREAYEKQIRRVHPKAQVRRHRP